MQVFQIKRSEYLHWVPGHFFKKKVPWRTWKNLKSVTCQRFPKIENILFVNKNKYFLRDTIEVLELPHIFVQADKQLYVRILHIKWKKRDLYWKIIAIMDGFDQMRNFQRVLFKRELFSFYKIGLLILEELPPDQLVKHLEGDITTAQCGYIKKDLIILFKEE